MLVDEFHVTVEVENDVGRAAGSPGAVAVGNPLNAVVPFFQLGMLAVEFDDNLVVVNVGDSPFFPLDLEVETVESLDVVANEFDSLPYFGKGQSDLDGFRFHGLSPVSLIVLLTGYHILRDCQVEKFILRGNFWT